MAAPKIRPEDLQKLYLREKKTVEALIERLNVQLQKDPKACQKAALILACWLRENAKK